MHHQGKIWVQVLHSACARACTPALLKASVCMDNAAVKRHWIAPKTLFLLMQGRPKDGPEDKFRLAPVAPRLSELLGSEVNVVQDCIGEDVAAAVEAASNGSVRHFQLWRPRLAYSVHTLC